MNRLAASKTATRRGGGADDRGGPRQSRQRAVSTTTGRAAGAHLTGQRQDGKSRVPACASSTRRSLTEAGGPLLIVLVLLALGVGWALLCWRLHIDGDAFTLSTALLLLGVIAGGWALYPGNSSTEDASHVPGADRAGGRDHGRV